MGPVLDDDDIINKSEKKDEEPVVYEGPARPPLPPSSSRSNIEATVNSNNSGGKKRVLEPVPAVLVGPARPASISSGADSDCDNDDVSRLRAEEWESVKKTTKVLPFLMLFFPLLSFLPSSSSSLFPSSFCSVDHCMQVSTVKREEWMTELPPERSANRMF